MNQSYLKTENLTVGYHGIPLIREIALSLSKGEIIALIGPNGAGKSTILKSLCNQLKMISGQIRIEDVSIQELNEKARAVKAR